MSKKIFILGAGGMAKEAYQIYCDLEESDTIGGFLVTSEFYSEGNIGDKPIMSIEGFKEKDFKLLIAIGSPKRLSIARKYYNGEDFGTLISPFARLGRKVEVGVDTIIGTNSVLTCDILVGEHTIINTGTIISHNCTIGDEVTIGPGCNIAGNVQINYKAWIGIGVTILPGVTIGNGAFIGAGSLITKNVPNNTIVYGVPGKNKQEFTKKDF
jgi:acetyltransferase EpsM